MKIVNNKVIIVLLQIIPLLLLLLCCVLLAADDGCPKCGSMDVPHPLSTSESCGNSSYRLHCKNGSLELLSAVGFYYKVLSINLNASRLIISTPFIEEGCHSSDLSLGGFKIDKNSTFKISPRNTIMLLNCSNKNILLSPLNCSSSSPGRVFEAGVGRGCQSMLCCSYVKERTMDLHRVRVSVGGCSAYTCVVDFKEEDGFGSWRFGIELQWLPLMMRPTKATYENLD